MAKDFDLILDECIDRISRGETVAACLADYPEHSEKLVALLEPAAKAKAVHAFTPSPDAKRAARQRFYTALGRRQQPSFLDRLAARRWVLGTVATVLVLAVVGYVILRTTVVPVEPPVLVISGPSAAGNFIFLVSDEENAIAEFSNLSVTLSKVAMLNRSGTERWVEFVPEVKEFDLVKLPGVLTEELWRGDVPEGDYSSVVISVQQVRGDLKAGGNTIDIKLPSNKLQLSLPFRVGAGSITSFTYDLTVVKTGNAQNGGKYLLKPQASESGASHQPDPAKDKGQGQGQQKPPR